MHGRAVGEPHQHVGAGEVRADIDLVPKEFDGAVAVDRALAELAAGRAIEVALGGANEGRRDDFPSSPRAQLGGTPSNLFALLTGIPHHSGITGYVDAQSEPSTTDGAGSSSGGLLVRSGVLGETVIDGDRGNDRGVRLMVDFATGGERRPMTMIDLLNVPALSDPRLAPDGTRVLYVLSESDWSTKTQIPHIWRANFDGSPSVQLTRGKRGETSPRWSPDGRLVAFLAETGEGESSATQIFLLSPDGGERRQLTSHPTSVSDIAWAPDGKSIYFLADDARSEAEQASLRAHDVYVFEENYRNKHLWRVAVESGETTKLSDGDFSIWEYRVSRDGSRIVCHRGPSPLLDDRRAFGQIWVMDSCGGEATQVTRESHGESGAELSPDNSQVLFLSGVNDQFEPYYTRKIFIIPAAGGAATRLLGDQSFEVNEAHWSQDGNAIFFTANTGVRAELFRFDLSNQALTQLTGGEHAVGEWDFNPEREQHAFTLAKTTNPGDVWTIRSNGAEPSAPEQVTHVFDYLARDFELPRTEAIQWQGDDGVEVEGLLSYPLDYQPGRRYPLVVQTHGGPASSDKFGFGGVRSYRQVLNGKGYFVLQPNYRGSTGYGDDFFRDMVGHYFHQSHLDVLAGVDHLVELGLADPERLVKMGYSAGGVMTKKVVTFTDRFKAASAGAGASSWISMYYEGDLRVHRHPWFGGPPWSATASEREPWPADAPIALYWEHSPLKYISNVKTPTLIFAGDRDVRNPMNEGIAFYRALKGNGIPTRLYVVPGKGHGGWDLHHVLFKANAELEWFERWVMERDYTWEELPHAE